MRVSGGGWSALLSLALVLSVGRPARAEDADAGPRGSLPRETIREVVRQNIGEVRLCYERELVREPMLRGRVVVSFIIEGDGSVRTVGLASSTMTPPGPRAAAVEACVQAAVRSFRFPPPTGGGSVLVNYPFIFDSTG